MAQLFCALCQVCLRCSMHACRWTIRFYSSDYWFTHLYYSKQRASQDLCAKTEPLRAGPNEPQRFNLSRRRVTFFCVIGCKLGCVVFNLSTAGNLEISLHSSLQPPTPPYWTASFLVTAGNGTYKRFLAFETNREQSCVGFSLQRETSTFCQKATEFIGNCKPTCIMEPSWPRVLTSADGSLMEETNMRTSSHCQKGACPGLCVRVCVCVHLDNKAGPWVTAPAPSFE